MALEDIVIFIELCLWLLVSILFAFVVPLFKLAIYLISLVGRPPVADVQSGRPDSGWPPMTDAHSGRPGRSGLS